MSVHEPRDGVLDRLYREAGREEPPLAADRAILAHARAAAAARSQRDQATPSPAGSAASAASSPPVPAPPAALSRGEAHRDGDDPLSEMWPLRAPRSSIMRWRVPLAVAATLVVSGTLVLMMQPAERVDDTPARATGTPPPLRAPGPSTPSEAPANAARLPERKADATGAQGATPALSAPAPTPVPPAPTDAARGGTAPSAARPLAADDSREGLATRARAAPAPPSEAAQGAPAASESTTVLRDAEENPGGRPRDLSPPATLGSHSDSAAALPPDQRAARPTAPVPTPPRASAPASVPDLAHERAAPVIASPGAAVEEPDAPEAIVERIRSLRRAGRDDQARALLRELVARHPGFILPEDLRQSF